MTTCSKATLAGLLGVLMSAAPVAKAPPQANGPLTLRQYIDSLHWDPAKSGTLIALEPDKLYLDDKAPQTLAGFEQRKIKVGNLSVIAQSWTVKLDDADLPNPYQALTSDEKLLFLLATLSTRDIEKLTGQGLCANDLSGEQKLALLSMLPMPFQYMEGQSSGNGFHGSRGTAAIPDDQMGQVKVQLCRCVNIAYGSVKLAHGYSNSSLSSFYYRGPKGAPIVKLSQGFFGQKPSEYLGRIVDSDEKRSDLAWSDTRLLKEIPLASSEPVGELLQSVSHQTGVELYADTRIGSLQLSAYGQSASARDLLRGVGRIFGGTYRRVGPAYVLTADVEGEATREVRLRELKALSMLDTAANVRQWKQVVARRNLLGSIQFPPDDTLDASQIPADCFAAEDGAWDANWVPVSRLPQALQTAISDASTSRKPNDAETPNPSLQDQVKVTTNLGYRFVLPDGRTTEFYGGVPGLQGSTTVPRASGPGPKYPLDPKLLRPGTSVAIRSDDPAETAKLCTELKAAGISEVWLESQSLAAILAAVSSGLPIDLVIRPWRLLKGESCADPDRTVLGQTGGQLNTVPGAGFNFVSKKIFDYGDSISPSDANLARHWGRLCALIPKQGLHGIVLLESQPAGYERATGWFESSMAVANFDGETVPAPLQVSVSAMFDFGYTTEQRLQYLRGHGIDPIDITNAHRLRLAPLVPYFDPGPPMPGPLGPYPNVEFPRTGAPLDEKLITEWQDGLHAAAGANLAVLYNRMSALSGSIKVELFAAKDEPGANLSRYTVVIDGLPADKIDFSKTPTMLMLSLGPANAEDAQGNLKIDLMPSIVGPVCFDLRQVAPGRVLAYLGYLFKPGP